MACFVLPALFDSLSAILALGDARGPILVEGGRLCQYCTHESNIECHAQKAIL